MKIIKAGKAESERTFTVRCSVCSCEFEFLQHEGKVIRDFRDGDYIQINCPTCISHVTVAL